MTLPHLWANLKSTEKKLNKINKQQTEASKSTGNSKIYEETFGYSKKKILEIPLTSPKQVRNASNAKWSKCFFRRFFYLFQLISKSFASLNIDLSRCVCQLTTLVMNIKEHYLFAILVSMSPKSFRLRCTFMISLITILGTYPQRCICSSNYFIASYTYHHRNCNDNFHFNCELVWCAWAILLAHSDAFSVDVFFPA